ncbi:MAG TPA: tRNA (adenosine(37)-N6)-threonylcarbamoyltransferase complex ATPase subunit type 1 TsaE [Candidatus Paceibacterota bacterium]
MLLSFIMRQTIDSLVDMEKFAVNFVSKLLPHKDKATVVGLYGNLGAGKTTLTQFIAKAFGVEDVVASPTFVIEKIYDLTRQRFAHLVHIDAYRLDKSEELLHLGWKEIISNPKNLILIEWSERVADIMPKHIRINLTYISENSREIEILE